MQHSRVDDDLQIMRRDGVVGGSQVEVEGWDLAMLVCWAREGWNPPTWQCLGTTRSCKENPHELRTCSHSPAKSPNKTTYFQSAAGHIKMIAVRTCSNSFSPSSTRTTTFQISDWRSWALQIVHTAELRQERAARLRERRLIYITLHHTCCNLDSQRPPFGFLFSQSRDDSTSLQFEWCSFSMIATLLANDLTPALRWHPQRLVAPGRSRCRFVPLLISPTLETT
jgi:hypothetical protein